MSYRRFLIFLLLFPVPFSCSKEKPPVTPWHNLERSIRYHPDDQDFVIDNGKRRFNRAIYGTHTGFRIEAGDLPEFALYLPGMGGNLKLGIGNKDASKWLTEAEEIHTRYRPGSMIYEIRDPMLGRGTLTLHLLAMAEEEGLILKVQSLEVDAGTELFWAFGGATGKRFPRDGDIGADPESVFYLHPEYCADNEFDVGDHIFTLYFGSGRVRTESERYETRYTPSAEQLLRTMLKEKKRLFGTVPPGCEIHISDARRQDSPAKLWSSAREKEGVLSGKMPLNNEGQDLYFMIAVPGRAPDPENIAREGLKIAPDSYQMAPEKFRQAEEARETIAGRIRVQTPDPYINTLGPALAIAADAIWEPPSYLHGAVAWRMRLPGWRGAYAADWLGWHDRARMHFDAYSRSQYTSPPAGPNVPDPKTNLSRQEEKAGNALFSSGYISRYPGRISRPHHYDMNLVFIDQLLWHILWTGDLEYARKVWPVIQRHLDWEKRCFDADGDGLYNAYCCIWASDALQYSGGGVTHSSAYNYRGNLLAGRLAEMLGEDPGPYLQEAGRISRAVQDQLWMPQKGWYAEYKDGLGLRLLHPAAALWTIYHALDAGLPDAFQAFQSLRYVDKEIPHIPIIADGMPSGNYYTLSTSNWMPYAWSINNVALAENLHTCLAYWQGGRPEEAFRLWKSQLLESMYNGASPGNFQQLSFYDAFRGELYRDFADPIGMAARTLVEGLFGILPDAPARTLLIRPGLPDAWDSASLETPDIHLAYRREGNLDHYLIIQSFPVPLNLRLRIRARAELVEGVLVNGRESSWENTDGAMGNPVIEIPSEYKDSIHIRVAWSGTRPEKAVSEPALASGDRLELAFDHARVSDFYDPQQTAGEISLEDHSLSFRADGLTGHRTVFARIAQGDLSWWVPICFELKQPVEFITADSLKKNELKFRIRNNRLSPLEGRLKVNGSYFAKLNLSPGNPTAKFSVPPELLVPGSNRVSFETANGVYTTNLVNWNVSTPPGTRWETVDLSAYFNDRVSQIFQNEYLSPRSSSPTLQIPVQGIGDWCSYRRLPNIDDRGLRKKAGQENRLLLEQGIPLRTPGDTGAKNILFTSRWYNYPDRVSIPLSGKASHACLLLAGSAHHMQSRICNGIVRISYSDGTSDSLLLVHPDTWWPIEQDYYIDGYAFRVGSPKPPRIYLKTGEVQKGDYPVLRKNGTNDIDGGAASLYDLPLDIEKEISDLSLETLANDVVIGLMSISLLRME